MGKMRGHNPQAGGTKIPGRIQSEITKRIQDYACEHYAGKYNRIDVRFKGQFCYLDAYVEPGVPEQYDPAIYGETLEARLERLRNTPLHLCRLRYFNDMDHWTLAFYTYSHEKYEPCVFQNGSWHGTLEEAFDIGAMYLE